LQSHCARSGIPDVYMFCIDVINHNKVGNIYAKNTLMSGIPERAQ